MAVANDTLGAIAEARIAELSHCFSSEINFPVTISS
jgi:hypothetical protein